MRVHLALAMALWLLPQPLIAASSFPTIDEADRVALAGNTRSEVTPAGDRGAVADDLPLAHMQLLLKRSPEREAALEAYVEELTDPASANYGRWLTAAEIGRRYGPAALDIHRVTRWLSGHGFAVNTVYPGGTLVDFSGTAGQVRTAFHTAIHRFAVGDEGHIANVADPEIPAALAGLVAGPVSLADIFPRSGAHMRPAFSTACTSSQLSSDCRFVTPADLATIYNLAPLFADGNTGAGHTIALVEDSDIYSAADWKSFRALFGLSKYKGGSLSLTHSAAPSGPHNCDAPGANKDDFEATLDAEYASAVAPSAFIRVANLAGKWPR